MKHWETQNIKQLQPMEKGRTFKIDRFCTGDIEEYTILRICKKHINVKGANGTSWAMPYNRIKDIINHEQ